MTRPRVSRRFIYESDAPPCPHCGGSMDEATITLEDLVVHWPLPDYVHVREDGYAPSTAGLMVTCRHCDRPAALAISEIFIKLIAARTAADEALLGHMP